MIHKWRPGRGDLVLQENEATRIVKSFSFKEYKLS